MTMSIKFLLIAFIEKKKRTKEQPKRSLFFPVEEGGLESSLASQAVALIVCGSHPPTKGFFIK